MLRYASSQANDTLLTQTTMASLRATGSIGTSEHRAHVVAHRKTAIPHSGSNNSMDTQKSAPAHRDPSGDPNTSSKSPLRSSPTHPGPRLLGIEWLLLSTMFVAALFMHYGPPNIWPFLNEISPHQDIPRAYAVCTPSEAGIYTVDDEDSKVECMLVNGDKIAITGTRGRFLC